MRLNFQLPYLGEIKMNDDIFFDNLGAKEKDTILTFARNYFSGFCFRNFGDPEPPVARLPEAVQDYYYNLWIKLDDHMTRRD